MSANGTAVDYRKPVQIYYLTISTVSCNNSLGFVGYVRENSGMSSFNSSCQHSRAEGMLKTQCPLSHTSRLAVATSDGIQPQPQEKMTSKMLRVALSTVSNFSPLFLDIG
jgi:hypothetical protein